MTRTSLVIEAILYVIRSSILSQCTEGESDVVTTLGVCFSTTGNIIDVLQTPVLFRSVLDRPS